MAKFSFKMTDADIVVGIASIGKAAARTRDQVHMVACSIIRNWITSGDAATAARRATELTAHIDPSHAQKAVNWFGKFCKFEYDKQNKAYVYTVTTIPTEVFQAAREKSMFQLTKDAVPEPYNLVESINRVLDTATKRALKQREGDAIDLALVRRIREVLAA